MKFSANFIRAVERYRKSGNIPIPISERGMEQFWRYESKGERFPDPDPSFVWLVAAKARWEWTLNEMRRAYDGETDPSGWPGWLELEELYADDPEALRQIRQRIGLRVGDVEATT